MLTVYLRVFKTKHVCRSVDREYPFGRTQGKSKISAQVRSTLQLCEKGENVQNFSRFVLYANLVEWGEGEEKVYIIIIIITLIDQLLRFCTKISRKLHNDVRFFVRLYSPFIRIVTKGSKNKRDLQPSV